MKTKRAEKSKRLPRPPCLTCKTKMVHFTKGERVDTWICVNPSCAKFDITLSRKCPACGTDRMSSPNNLFICMNPECPSFKKELLTTEEVADLESKLAAQREAVESAMAAPMRAKKGQGTQPAARRRREARAKAAKQASIGLNSSDEEIDEAMGEGLSEATGHKVSVEGAGRAVRKAMRKHPSPDQTYITLPDVKRDIVSTDYEIFKHISTQLIFRRKAPDIGAPDPLTGKNLGENAAVLSDEDKVASIAKKLKGSKWSAKTAESAATEILKVINGTPVDGVEQSEETVNHVEWRAGLYTIKKKEDSWQGEKGKKTKLQKKFAIKGKGTGDTYAKEQHEAARGEIRVFTQDGMKKLKGELVEGKQFEGAYVALYKRILIEVNPDDDEDPGRAAPAEEWLHSALPDSKVQA